MKKFLSMSSKWLMASMMTLQVANAADEVADTDMDNLWGERLELDAGERGAWFKQAKYAMLFTGDSTQN